MADNTLTGLEIAVIGMAGRFPGAHDIHEFWDNLIDAKESITFFSDEELAAAGVKSDLIKDPGYVKAGPVLADTCYFDANFFGYSPAEAEVMVPQARIFHECAWAALEDAGYDPLAYQGTVGCYVGSSSAFPWQAYSFLTGKHQNLGDWPSLLLSSKDNLGTHLAYKLDLSGPCFTFFSACSTSLVAVHLGSRALLTGECRMAVVGAVTLDTIGKPGYLYQEGMISSPDGHCRAFAGDAAGTIFGEGAGAAILKRYREAVDDKDHIYAVIKGSAVNNDGLRRVGYTAPGSRGQQEVVELALKAAKVSPESITYVETHGTGTSLGDPVEFQALTEAFNTDKKQFCAIASVKTNIGHLDTAAGIAGFIKAVLALYHGLIPPGLHFDSPNPAIDFENGPFYVNTELKQWTADEYPLRAGVSSFGIGGTNAHVILEQASHAQGAGPKAYHQEQEVHGTGPMAQEPGSQGRGGVSPPAAAQEYQLILLSARTPTALQKMTRNLANYLKENQNNLINLPGHSLGNVAFTLQVGRRVFQHRRMAVCSTIGVAIEALTHPDDAKMKTFADTEKNQEPPVVFMFPGLGSEYVNMGRELYEKQPLFREEMNRCFEILKPLLGYDIKEILYPFPGSDRSYPSYKSYKSHINQTEIAQPVIFIFEYALAKILMDWGIKPRAVMGYSFGEYAAACAAGVFSLEDALKLVAARGRLVQEVEPGAMLSVPVSKQELSQLLDSNQELGLSLSIDNGLSCIAAGSNEAVDVFEKRLKEKKLLCMRLPVSRAFHSPMMAAVAMEFQEVVASLTRKPPQIPYVSNVTGTWIRTDQALDPGYWATHLRQPVCFADGLNVLVNKWKNVLFLEVGPGRDLSALITRTIENKPGQRVLHLVRHPQKQVPDLYFLMNQVGRLWLYGKSPDWNRLYPNEKRQRISLPTYPFDPHYYPSRGDPLDIGTKMLSPQMVLEKRPDISSWFYIPSWKRSLLPSPVILPPAPSRCWLLLVDNLGLGDQLAKKLENQKQEVILVSPGDGFSKTSQRQYTISPGQLAHYRALLRELQRTGKIPGKILHLWSVSGNNKEKPDREAFDRAQELGLYSLCHLAAAIGRLDFGSDFEIIVISDNIQEVTGRENLAPEKSTVMAVAKVIPQEYPYIICRAIDVVLEEPGSWREKRMLAQLHAELCAASPDTVIAYRDGYRWIQVFEPVRLEEIPGDIPSPRLKTGGVYLITGGLGGLGLTLAGFLARTLRAKLVLTTRSFFPARQEWDQWLVKHGENHNTSIKIRQIKEFEKAGAEVRVFNADAADESEMRRGINLAEEQWGPINGVIHAAGIPGGSASFNMIDKLAKPDFQEQFQAKVYGLLVLEKLLRNRPLDFCLLTSSLSPILGGVGFAAYSAANQFMDSFVYKHNRVNPPKWISLNWGDWQPWNPTERESIIGGTVNQFNMMPREGIETFRRILYYCQTSQVVVSSGDLRGRIDQWVKLKTLRDRDEANKPGPSPVYRRSHLSDAYIAPRDPWEQTLADIWQRLFGFDRIGIRDDFFELGGDSLKAITLAAKIHHQLKVEIPLPEFFERTTIETLARYTREQSVRRHEDSDIPLEIVEKKEYYLLSSAQERLFILQQMQKDFTGYNDQMAFVMEGILDKYRLERAFRGVIQRHESLRTSFHVVDEVPVQMVQTGAGFEIEYHQSLVNSQGRGEVSSPIKIETITREFVRSFDLACAPLLRVGLISLDNKKALLMIDMHHIVFDGTSMGILLDEVTRLYTGEEPPRLKIQYKDFSTWQNRLLKTGKIKRQEEYWLNLYRDSPDIPGLNLPYDYPRPHVMSFEGDYYGFRLAGEDILGFKALAVENDATLYMNLLAALKVLLYKYTGQDDIIVGSAIVGRPRQDLQPIIGMFVNTLALRSRPGQCQTYPQWLLKVKAACIKAFENQDLQFEDLVHRLDLQRDPSRNPLFDVCFAFQNFEQPQIQLSEITFTPYELKNKTSRFDMTIFAWEKPGEIVFGVEYCTRLFKPAAVRRFAGHLLEVIRQVSGVPGIRLADIEILTREEKQRLLYDFNDTARDYPADQTIHRLFAAEAANNPDQAALVGPHALHNEGTRGLAPLYITYRELNKKSGQFALVLKEKGIQPDTIVGIMAGRSIEMVIGILAILKAGAAYLSIDVEYPQKRIARMLADSSAKILVTTPGLSEKFEKLLIVNCQLLIINEKTLSINNYQLTIDNLQLKGDNLAYVIYTSGSTGIPKGVMVTHRNVVRLVKNTNYVEFKQGQRILPTGALEFDASTFEVWGALLNGLSLYLAPKEDILTVERLKESLEKYNISTIWMTSPLFNRMVLADPGIFAGLKNLLVGGDVLSPLHINQVRTRYPGVNIINGYGPTENTTFSTTFLIDKEYKTNIPIGTPIANSTAYIVDKYYRLQPINVPGELWVGGDGVSRGYMNDPELTAEKFDHDLWDYRDYHDGNHRSYRSHTSYFYRTGDLARWLPDGNIQFLGRIDHQVKISGFRIELGEIESLLLKHDKIKEAVVLAGGDGLRDKYLCAYIVVHRRVGVRELREFLSKSLPEYMIPSYMVTLEKIPLTPNGKVDGKALPVPGIVSGEAYIAPRDELEKKLVEIWSGILARDPKHASQLRDSIGIDDNFFELGGHSLKAAIMISRIHEELSAKIPLGEIFRTPFIRGLSGHIREAKRDRYISIQKVENREYYALSSAQQRMYLLREMETGSTAYNLPAVVLLQGQLNRDRFVRVFKQLTARHESFRTSFVMVAGKPVQRIHDKVEFEIEYDRPVVNCQGRGEVASPARIEKMIREFVRPFDLSYAPLLRVGLMELPHTPAALRSHPRRGTYKSQEGKEPKYILMVDIHHIISDGASLGILTREFMALYADAGDKLPLLKLQYKDYSKWQNSEKEKESLVKQEAYWLNQFPGDIPVLELPVDFNRPAIQSFEGRTKAFEIGKEETSALKRIASHKNTTLYMVLLAVYSIFLSKISSREDIVIGTPTAGRKHTDLVNLIGMFVNTLAVRNYPIGEKTFEAFLKEVKEKTLEAFENQDYQFEELVEKVILHRDAGRNPLFDVTFALRNLDIIAIEIPGLKLNPYPYESTISKFDLGFEAVETEEQLLFEVTYSTKLFKEETIHRFFRYFNTVISGVCRDSNKPILELEILSPEEKQRLLFDFNDTATAYPAEMTIYELFEEQVEKYPHYIAVTGPLSGPGKQNLQLTYNQLNKKSLQLARVLQLKGVQPDSIVGIMMERSLEMIIGLLGILGTGAAYLPVDLEFPRERINYMLKDSQAKILLKSNSNTQNNTATCLVLNFEHLNFEFVSDFGFRISDLSSSNLAYIIYTSGTTGKPKGVMTTQANVTRVVKKTNYIRLTGEDRILQLSNYAFDGSVFDIYGALLNGAALVMIKKDDVLAVDRLSSVIKQEAITVFFVTTALFNTLVNLEISCLKQVRKILFGGERVSLDHVRKAREYLGKNSIIHVYGPTETTVYATYYFIDGIADSAVTIPIGKPISNTTVYILDKNLKLVPVGVTGEIYIGGSGTARGYLNSPELTAEKFCLRRPGGALFVKTAPPGPPRKNFSLKMPGKGFYRSYPSHTSYITHKSYFYRTGDLARQLPDGSIEFLGRIDQQVKLRGFRIELGEIESLLLEHEKIKEAIVLTGEDERGDKYLCAYIVAHREVSVPGLRKYLSKNLPDYMIPSYFVTLEKIPLNPNGKVDGKALPAPGARSGEVYIAPGNEIEKILVEIWSEVLGKTGSSIGIDDNFFELGGHSLKAAMVISGIHKELNVKVPLTQLFITPFIRGLSSYIKETVEDRYIPMEKAETREYYPLSSAQKRLYILQQVENVDITYNMPVVTVLEGQLRGDRLEETFHRLIKRHESFRTCFKMAKGEPVQVVHHQVEFEIEYDRSLVNCQGRGEVSSPVQTGKIIREFIRPFDLSRAPLLRVGLMELEENQHILMIDMHHIISDGISMGILTREFMAIYGGKRLSPIRLQYKDFSLWQNSKKGKEIIKKQEDYWFGRFQGKVPVLKLPYDYPRPLRRNFAGATRGIDIPEQDTRALKKLAKEEEVTLFMVLTAVYKILLSNLGWCEDIVVGTPVSGRQHAELRHTIGMFVNTLALRNFPNGEKTFTGFLKEIKENTLHAFENQLYPFEDLVEKIIPDRDTSRNPLFDTMFTLQNIDIPGLEIPGLKMKPYEYKAPVSKFDLTLVAVEKEHTLGLAFEYGTQLFKEEKIKRFLEYFKEILHIAAADPHIKLNEIQLPTGLSDLEESAYEEVDGDFAF